MASEKSASTPERQRSSGCDDVQLSLEVAVECPWPPSKGAGVKHALTAPELHDRLRVGSMCRHEADPMCE